MTRAVLGGRRGWHSDVAIAMIEPLPGEQVSFTSIRDVLDDFLRNHRMVSFRSIQPCPYGQACVRFSHFHDRDFLIQSGPHQYGNYRISFVPHHKGWNHRATTMNYEVWLMLLGYNLDFCETQDIEKTIAEFGKLLVWEEDPTNLARIIVKARLDPRELRR